MHFLGVLRGSVNINTKIRHAFNKKNRPKYFREGIKKKKNQKQILEINATMKTMYKKQISILIITLVSLRIMF